MKLMYLNSTNSCCSTPHENTIDAIYIQQLDWILPVAINVTTIVVQAWFIISLLYYGIKTKKWKELHHGSADKLNSGAVYTSLVACGVFGFIQSVVNLVYITFGFNLGEDKLCDSLGDASSGTNVFVVTSESIFCKPFTKC